MRYGLFLLSTTLALILLVSLPATVTRGQPARGKQPPAGRSPAPSTPEPAAINSDCSPTEAELRSLVADLYGKYQDPMELLKALDAAVGYQPPRMASPAASIIIFHSEDLFVHVLFPYASFRFNLSEAIRKKEPIDKVGVFPGVVVNVSPSRINAPDIIKIVVERNGQPVTPLMSLLQPKEMETRLGVKRIIHAGSVTFPCSAFVPGASVTVTAIPESGTNIVKTINSEELATRR